MTGRHAALVKRQLTAVRRVVTVGLLVAALVITLATTQLVVHGWEFFVDRPPGVGATDD